MAMTSSKQTDHRARGRYDWRTMVFMHQIAILFLLEYGTNRWVSTLIKPDHLDLRH